MHTWNILEDRGNHKKRTLQCMDHAKVRRHTEGNVATMNEVIHSGWLSKEEWDAEACITAEDDGVYFVEDMIESEALSSKIGTKDLRYGNTSRTQVILPS